MAGSFIISLDFELHWGGAEKWDLSQKKNYFINTREVVNQLLQLFSHHEIRVTWATVGFLFADNLVQLKSYFPKERPAYQNQNLDYYKLFDNNLVGENENLDPFHFANSLIKEIVKHPGQELASHTFCHYYCLENGQTKMQFEQDLQASQAIAKDLLGVSLSSLVFPRNQFNAGYNHIIQQNAYKVIRTNPKVWFWQSNSKYNFLARAIDTLLPISSRLSFANHEITKNQNLVELPASRFFRPFSKKELAIQALKMRRIKSEMLAAAKNGENYHLWWHPHNFGDYPKENLQQLEEILKYYDFLKKQYNFNSKCMGDFA